MEEIELSFDVQNTRVAGTATITLKELSAPYKSNNQLWTITLKSQIFDRTESNSFSVLLASDKEACGELYKLLRQLYEIDSIRAFETETVIKIKCLHVPTMEFIKNGAFPDLFQKILVRDPLWKMFPPSSISKIFLIATVVVENLDEKELCGECGRSFNIQIGDNCTQTLCPKRVSYCHQVGNDNFVIVNILNTVGSSVSMQAEGRVMIKIFSKDEEWTKLQEEIILNTEQAKQEINHALEKCNIKLEHIKLGCIIFVLQLLKKEDSQNLLKENGPVMNLFRAITETGYWNVTLKEIKKKAVLPVFRAEVGPFYPDMPEGVLYHTEAESTSYNRDNEKELHVFEDEQKCKIHMTFGEGFRKDFERIMKENTSLDLRVNTKVIEPKEASFLPLEKQQEDAYLSHANTILEKYGLHLVFVRNENPLFHFHFHFNTKIDEDKFMEAISSIVFAMGQIKLLEMKLELIPSEIKMQHGKSLEFTLYPANKFKEAVEKDFLPNVIRTLISTCNPEHMQRIKHIDVEVSSREERGITDMESLKRTARKENPATPIKRQISAISPEDLQIGNSGVGGKRAKTEIPEISRPKSAPATMSNINDDKYSMITGWNYSHVLDTSILELQHGIYNEHLLHVLSPPTLPAASLFFSTK